MTTLTSTMRRRRDPLATARAVELRELNDAIAWTAVYLRGLRDRLARGIDIAPRGESPADLMRLDDDHDIPRCRLEAYREALADPSPAAHPPIEPESIDITLAEHTHLIGRQRDLAATAMQRFHEVHDGSYDADDDGHFDRQGHVQERCGERRGR